MQLPVHHLMNYRRRLLVDSTDLVREEDTGSLETAFIEYILRKPAGTFALRAYEIWMHDPDLNVVPRAERLKEPDVDQGCADDDLIILW